ncbi:MAG: hypothetical protein GY867_01460 [bacterium]|nr:hypothetical protein [bacterium]
MHGCIKILGAFGFVCLLTVSSVIADFEGTVWNPFGDGISLKTVEVVEAYQGDLWAAGFAYGAGADTIAHIVRWDGSVWQPMGEAAHLWIHDLVEYDGQLIAVAESVVAGDTLSCAIAWNGTAWIDLGFGPDGDFRTATIWDGKLAVAGHFDTAAGVAAKNVAVWDGSSWTALGEGLGGRVQVIMEFEGNLIAGGDFTETGDGTPVANIARWNGIFWEPMGDGFTGDVSALIVYDGKLTVGGRPSMSGGLPVGSVAAWDGSSWSAVGDGTDLFEVSGLAEFHGELIAAGFSNAIRRFDGSDWHEVLETWGTVKDVAVFDDKLVIAGREFGSFYGFELNNIAWRASFDQDADGIYDINDNCIWADNPIQENADGDLSGDACDDCYGCETSVYLESVSGLRGGDTVYAGTPVKFYFAVSGFPDDNIMGLAVGLSLSSPDGAVWQPPVLDTVPMGWLDGLFDVADFISSGVTGADADSLSAHWVAIAGDGLEPGFNDVAFCLTTEFSADQEGKTICIDSASWSPVTFWEMMYGGSLGVEPFWDGPHCFTIYNCCQGPTVGDMDMSGVVDVTDIQVIIDNQFLSLTPLTCEIQGDLDFSGIIDITDLSILVDNQFLTLTPLSPCP